MTGQDGKRYTLLLVDDESGFVAVLAKRLGRRCIDVTCATSGAEAVQILRKCDFSAAVVDLKMEDMDGIELLKIFKTMSPSMPVFLLTGHGSEEAARQGIALGACDYLTKPYDIDQLAARVKKAASRSGED